MTYEESIHTMLEQVLRNQVVLLWHLGHFTYAEKWTKDHIEDTDILLEQVQE